VKRGSDRVPCVDITEPHTYYFPTSCRLQPPTYYIKLLRGASNFYTAKSICFFVVFASLQFGHLHCICIYARLDSGWLTLIEERTLANWRLGTFFVQWFSFQNIYTIGIEDNNQPILALATVLSKFKRDA
jgi:hypothetical protein